MKRRLPEFDIAKAVALAAVIIGHSSFAGFPKSVVDFCYSFDMPLFFIVSGYFCHPDAKLSPSYVKKNAKALLLPYLATSCLVVALSGVSNVLFSPNPDPLGTMLMWAKAALYGSGGKHPGMPDGVIGIGAIWYLWALFWAKLLLAEINRMPHPFIYSIMLFVVGVSTTGIIWLPLAIQNALCATLFLQIGQYVRSEDILKKMPPTLWICALGTWLYCGAFYGKLYMESNSFQHGLIDIFGGICGTLCIIKFGQILAAKAPKVALPIERFGSITLPFFCMHLVELNVIPWNTFFAWCTSMGIAAWAGTAVLHFAAAAILTALLRISPRPISSIFFKS